MSEPPSGDDPRGDPAGSDPRDETSGSHGGNVGPRNGSPGSQHRRERARPRREFPSTRQLGLPPRVVLLRGLGGKCPACGSRGIFRRWFDMAPRCPTCTLQFERVEGHWIGSIGTNMVVVLTVMFVLMLSSYLISYPDPPGAWLLWTELAIGTLGPILFFPSARMLWTALDILMRPLRPGEIDPRYVVFDPYRDHSPGDGSP